MLRALSTLWLLLGLSLPCVACGTNAAGECEIAADCESGSCGPDGQCNTELLDAGPDADPSQADAARSACNSVVDGIITHDELPLAPGRMANFRVATDAEFDTAGSGSGTTRSWDLDRALANDIDTTLVLGDPSSAWYASAFPSASYVSPLTQDSDLLGVFRLAEDGLLLLGVVSPTSGVTRTELSYDPPALLMPLPLEEGATWSTESQITGLASGVVALYTETYAGMSDQSGTLLTPFGEFRVLRTRMDLTRTLGISVTTTRQYSFVAECAGIVASILSEENEPAVNFQSAAEIRRLIP